MKNYYRIEERLLNLYNQYIEGVVSNSTVIAVFQSLKRGHELKLWTKENKGKYECYNPNHCCSQCCDCEFNDSGYAP